jgi:hypothetical protein
MELHKLEFIIDRPEEVDYYPKFIVKLDKATEQQSFVVLPLELSYQKDDLYPILNCTCGEWGCGGYYVEVRNEADYVVWQKIFRFIDKSEEIEPLHVKTPIYFERGEYIKLVNDLLREKDRFPQERSNYIYDTKEYQKNGLGSLYDLK